MRSVLAADLGGTKTRLALVGEDLSVHGASEFPTRLERGPYLAEMEARFRALTSDLPAGVEAPHAIGIGAAGVVAPDARSLLGAPNLPVGGFDLAGHLEQVHGLPTVVLNDGRASAWGEYLQGNAQGSDPLLVLFFGTGIGIGLIVGGRPYTGASNAAGEIGHTVHVPGGRPCICGNQGCFEAYCGGGMITKRALQELGDPPGDEWRVSDVLAIAGDDGAARQILVEAERAACALVASLCTLLNPRAVVLGGGVLTAWPDLATRVEAFARDWCSSSVVEPLRFVPSLGGSDAILWGAAAAAGLRD